jgi:hypothetical protein
MFRRTLPEGLSRRLLDRLANRLTKIIAEIRNLGAYRTFPTRVAGVS